MIEYAPQDRVDRYEAEVERILNSLGLRFEEVAVSDESILNDDQRTRVARRGRSPGGLQHGKSVHARDLS